MLAFLEVAKPVLEELSSIEKITNLGFNGGAFLMLIWIAYWLMKHVPGWITLSMTTQVEAAKHHKDTMAEMQETLKEEMRFEREQCQLQNDRTHASLEKHHDNMLRAYDLINTQLTNQQSEIRFMMKQQENK